MSSGRLERGTEVEGNLTRKNGKRKEGEREIEVSEKTRREKSKLPGRVEREKEEERNSR